MQHHLHVSRGTRARKSPFRPAWASARDGHDRRPRDGASWEQCLLLRMLVPLPAAPPAARPCRPGAPERLVRLHAHLRRHAARLPAPRPTGSQLPGSRLPLVLNLHGATQNAQLEEITSDMDPNADRTATWWPTPTGPASPRCSPPIPSPRTRSTGGTPGSAAACPVTKHINDVGFLLKVIADIAAKTPVDLRRVYMTGISNGGMMAYAMAAEASGHVAAISSVSGQVEIPVIHPDAGRADHGVPQRQRSDRQVRRHPEQEPAASSLGDAGHRPMGQGGRVHHEAAHRDGHRRRRRVDLGGRNGDADHLYGLPRGAEVALWRFTGSGHVWPGSPLNMGPKKNWILAGVGRGIILVNADETMWQFFEKYSLPSAPR